MSVKVCLQLLAPWRYDTTARLVSQSCTKGFILVELTSDGVWRSLQLRIIFVELWIITDTIDCTWYRIRNILDHPGVDLGPVDKRNWRPQNSFWSASSCREEDERMLEHIPQLWVYKLDNPLPPPHSLYQFCREILLHLAVVIIVDPLNRGVGI